ncbi:MAG: DmsE family decaheme c-type cytochrome [Bryobacteraceae bacterium]|nr:DmsE family decaheme c-type cytochrome [Bryobacteraceae bacterium]
MLHRLVRISLIWTLFALPPLWGQLPKGVTADAKGFVGANACRTCHPDVNRDFFRNAHYQGQVASCEGCHGPGQAHIEGRGDKTKIFAFSQKTARQTLDRCLTCHSKSMARSNIRRSEHTQADVVCASCHSIHKPATPKFLLAKKQIDLCGSCHAPVRAQFSMPFKHRVNEGVMQCSDCHNPHGTDAPTWRMGQRPRLVAQAQGNEEACLKCHVEKRGPFVFEHAGVRIDGCETCHSPHGSMNARLLKRPVTFTLCLECHNGAGNFGRQGDGIAVQSPSHNMADPRYQNCTTCHVKIHGSNGDRLFRR